jgi:hypothetical protein
MHINAPWRNLDPGSPAAAPRHRSRCTVPGVTGETLRSLDVANERRNQHADTNTPKPPVIAPRRDANQKEQPSPRFATTTPSLLRPPPRSHYCSQPLTPAGYGTSISRMRPAAAGTSSRRRAGTMVVHGGHLTTAPPEQWNHRGGANPERRRCCFVASAAATS